jgi:hypothetical protein
MAKFAAHGSRGLGHSADDNEIKDFEDFLKKTIPPLPEESSQGNL